MFRRLKSYDENCIGLPYPVLLLDSAEQEIDGDGNAIGIRIPELEGLASAVAVARCLDPVTLAGEEVRFVRRVLDYTQKELADRLEVKAAEVVSRWEHGAHQPGGYTEKLLRALAVIKLGNQAPAHAADCAGIVDLRLVARADGAWPEILARRVAMKGTGVDTWLAVVHHRWLRRPGGTVATEGIATDSR